VCGTMVEKMIVAEFFAFSARVAPAREGGEGQNPRNSRFEECDTKELRSQRGRPARVSVASCTGCSGRVKRRGETPFANDFTGSANLWGLLQVLTYGVRWDEK
jgi:hypothetical protein